MFARPLTIVFAVLVGIPGLADLPKLERLPKGASAEAERAYAACARREAGGCADLAGYFYAGRGVRPSFETSFQLRQRACDLASLPTHHCKGFRKSHSSPGTAERALGYGAISPPRTGKAFDAYRGAVRCDQGEKEGCTELAHFFLGRGGEADVPQAAALFRFACDRNDPIACPSAEELEQILSGGCREGDRSFCSAQEQVRGHLASYQGVPEAAGRVKTPSRAAPEPDESACAALRVHAGCKAVGCKTGRSCLVWSAGASGLRHTCEVRCGSDRPCPAGMTCLRQDGRGEVCHVVDRQVASRSLREQGATADARAKAQGALRLLEGLPEPIQRDHAIGAVARECARAGDCLPGCTRILDACAGAPRSCEEFLRLECPAFGPRDALHQVLGRWFDRHLVQLKTALSPEEQARAGAAWSRVKPALAAPAEHPD